MSLNICMDCNFEKKKCQCVVEEIIVKISWWKKILNWFR